MELREQAIGLLKQFGQIILHGPPGTGKTRLAREVAAAMLEVDAVDNHPQFAIVQFHPAYNYEDFVRGIQVSAENNNVAYNVVNRVFGEIAKRAADNGDPHVLVVDEINRANVSAVLGELIYGLEYRGKKIQTPYRVEGDAGLIIPRNLSVIGTMNTADRTIGQIDYAVRRRFAFLRCPPEASVVKEIGGDRALVFFHLVDGVFEHLSADYDKEDVCIGHSYFLAEGNKLANKIIYQVVPILREYVKDGVLKREAQPTIDAIEGAAKNLGKSNWVGESTLNVQTAESPGLWRWIRGSVPAMASAPRPTRRMVLSLIQDYASGPNCATLDDLRRAFPGETRYGPIVLGSDDPRFKRENYFTGDGEQIEFPESGAVAYVNIGWGTGRDNEAYFNDFMAQARRHGYKVYGASKAANHSPYWYVNTGQHEGLPHRAWENCFRHGFISGGQDDDPNLSHSSVSQLRRIPLGAIVFAYNMGYVGFGVVTREATPIQEFPAPGRDGETLAEALGADNSRDGFVPEKEFAIGVDWLLDKSQSTGVLSRHAYPNTASPIHKVERLRELKRVFGIVDESDDND